MNKSYFLIPFLVVAYATEAPTGEAVADPDMLDPECDADDLFYTGLCICDESPCFHHESMLFFERGTQLPYLLRRMLRIIGEMIDLRRNPTSFDSFFFPGIVDSYREKVRELSIICKDINSIVISDVTSWTTHEDASSDEAELSDKSSELVSFIQDQILDNYTSYAELLGMAEAVWSDESSYISNMEIPVLIVQAVDLVDRYVLLTKRESAEAGGWDADIMRFGVNVDDIGSVDVDEFINPMTAETRITAMQDLTVRAQQVTQDIDDEPFIIPIPQPEDDDLLGSFMMEMEILTRPFLDDEDLEIRHELLHILPPLRKVILRYFRWNPPATIRLRSKTVSQFLEFLRPVTTASDRLSLAMEFLYDQNSDFDLSLHDPEENPPFVLSLPAWDEFRYLSGSRDVLESLWGNYPLALGIEVQLWETQSVGDGVRREWLERMAKFYFRTEPEDADDFVYWEHSNASGTAIRPRRISDMQDEVREEELTSGLTACGRLIGIALRYGIVLGVPLSIATLTQLQRPTDDFDADVIALFEDISFYDNLEKLRIINWENPEEVDMMLAGETVIIPGGAEVPVTADNVGEYIRQKKFGKVVWSIRKEMQFILLGMHDIIKQGSLNVLSHSEISRMLIGSVRELTSEIIINCFDFPQGESEMKEWFIQLITEMSPQELRRLHKFVTGSASPPVGVAGSWMSFQTSPSLPTDTLPTARTCFGTILTPVYESIEIFRSKLALATAEGLSLEEQ